MPIDAGKIRSRIEAVAIAEAGLTRDAAHDVAFHLTDWLDDLVALHRFYQDPAALSDDAVDELLMGFLIHVPNHVAAAGKLYADLVVSDIFGVGAVEAAGAK